KKVTTTAKDASKKVNQKVASKLDKAEAAIKKANISPETKKKALEQVKAGKAKVNAKAATTEKKSRLGSKTGTATAAKTKRDVKDTSKAAVRKVSQKATSKLDTAEKRIANMKGLSPAAKK